MYDVEDGVHLAAAKRLAGSSSWSIGCNPPRQTFSLPLYNLSHQWNDVSCEWTRGGSASLPQVDTSEISGFYARQYSLNRLWAGWFGCVRREIRGYCWILRSGMTYNKSCMTQMIGLDQGDLFDTFCNVTFSLLKCCYYFTLLEFFVWIRHMLFFLRQFFQVLYVILLR